MPFPLIPVAVGGLIAIAAVVQAKRAPKMTEERREIYESALRNLKDPEKLDELATVFTQYGLVREGTLLKKRANLRRLPEAVKIERRAIFKKAVTSKNPNAVLSVAAAFENEGCTGAAVNLRRYAAELQAAS